MEEEKRTIEELLTQLRKEKDWTQLDLMQELSKFKIMVEEKTIKKWEVGLEYPDTDTIYRLSEIYYVPAETLIAAKGNSLKEGYKSIHTTFIKWFCYLTGLSLKIGYIFFYTVLYGALILSFLFFVGKCNEYVGVLKMQK